ncbi:MAG: hypothetical protein GTN36_01345, partial [Candidatus Aenigmarchaeota archaeon]|nr:hypothetical protein [Candidatus Aenigmarchaeota archaeon]
GIHVAVRASNSGSALKITLGAGTHTAPGSTPTGWTYAGGGSPSATITDTAATSPSEDAITAFWWAIDLGAMTAITTINITTTGGDVGAQAIFVSNSPAVACFGQKTPIYSSLGDFKMISELKSGDKIKVKDQKNNTLDLPVTVLNQKNNHMAVEYVIKKDSIAENIPSNDLTFSKTHFVLV